MKPIIRPRLFSLLKKHFVTADLHQVDRVDRRTWKCVRCLIQCRDVAVFEGIYCLSYCEEKRIRFVLGVVADI